MRLHLTSNSRFYASTLHFKIWNVMHFMDVCLCIGYVVTSSCNKHGNYMSYLYPKRLLPHAHTFMTIVCIHTHERDKKRLTLKEQQPLKWNERRHFWWSRIHSIWLYFFRYAEFLIFTSKRARCHWSVRIHPTKTTRKSNKRRGWLFEGRILT